MTIPGIQIMKRAALLATVACASLAHADVTLRHTDGNHTLLVDGRPFWIQGVGGDGPKQLLKDVGGNAFRTWGADDLDKQLAEAQRLGLKVACGIWLEHERHGFSYSDPAFVSKQLERAKATIAKYKNHPAVLLWAIGLTLGLGLSDDFCFEADQVAIAVLGDGQGQGQVAGEPRFGGALKVRLAASFARGLVDGAFAEVREEPGPA